MRLIPITSSAHTPIDAPLHDVSASHGPLTSASPAVGVSASLQNAMPDARAARLVRLIGARVPGGIDFSGVRPEPRGPAIPLYRHPADANAAATRLAAPSMIDVTA